MKIRSGSREEVVNYDKRRARHLRRAMRRRSDREFKVQGVNISPNDSQYAVFSVNLWLCNSINFEGAREQLRDRPTQQMKVNNGNNGDNREEAREKEKKVETGTDSCFFGIFRFHVIRAESFFNEAKILSLCCVLIIIVDNCGGYFYWEL